MFKKFFSYGMVLGLMTLFITPVAHHWQLELGILAHGGSRRTINKKTGKVESEVTLNGHHGYFQAEKKADGVGGPEGQAAQDEAATTLVAAAAAAVEGFRWVCPSFLKLMYNYFGIDNVPALQNITLFLIC